MIFDALLAILQLMAVVQKIENDASERWSYGGCLVCVVVSDLCIDYACTRLSIRDGFLPTLSSN